MAHHRLWGLASRPDHAGRVGSPVAARVGTGVRAGAAHDHAALAVRAVARDVAGLDAVAERADETGRLKLDAVAVDRTLGRGRRLRRPAAPSENRGRRRPKTQTTQTTGFHGSELSRPPGRLQELLELRRDG